MTESITPLVIGNLVAGYLLLGHLFSYDNREDGWEKIRDYTRNLQVDYTALKKACWERPLTSKEYIFLPSELTCVWSEWSASIRTSFLSV